MLQGLSTQTAIEEGAIYRRSINGRVVETAEVLELLTDRLGIPHVRFELRVTCGSTGATAEQRTLALDIFSARYKERV